MYKKIIFTCLLMLPVLALGHTLNETPKPDNHLQHGLSAYVNATCLANQKEAYLVEQGYAWANAIVMSEMAYDFERVVLPLNAAVKKAMVNKPMLMVLDESAPTKSKSLPLAYCYEISLQADIQALISELLDHES
ncbi:MAG: hypothetical protein RBR37_02940 [Advenella sp.]|nr:hypothetical protein [Advenella sp.]